MGSTYLHHIVMGSTYLHLKDNLLYTYILCENKPGPRTIMPLHPLFMYHIDPPKLRMATRTRLRTGKKEKNYLLSIEPLSLIVSLT